MTTLLESVVKPAVRSSSKSVFVFRSDLVAEFAADRLSGTEPKLKCYLEVVEPVPAAGGLGAARESAGRRLASLEAAVRALLAL